MNAINYLEKIGAEHIIDSAYNPIGIIYGRSGDSEVSCYTLTEEHNRRIGDVVGMGSTSVNMGISNKNMGNYAEAHRHYRDAEDIFTEKEILYGVAFVCVNRALLELLEKRYAEAIASNQKTVELAYQLGISTLHIHASGGMARVALAMQQYERSAKFAYAALNATSEGTNVKTEMQEVLASLREHLAEETLVSIEAQLSAVSDEEIIAMIRAGIPT